MKNEKKSLIRSESFQTLLASLVCVLGGLLVGYIALLIIEPSGAWKAITAVMKSFFNYPGKLMLKYFGQTLTRTVPLLMCALSVLFAYKVGMFNIGVAGQYVAGACGCLYAALAWNLPWLPCLLIGMVAAALLFGFLRALGNVYSGLGFMMALNIPSVVYNMLPYVISLVVLAFTSKKSRAPKAEGIPYDKGTR